MVATDSTGIPDDIKQKLMQDPAVQNAMKEAGKGALESLQDPKVQAQIMETCKEKFPQYASAAKDHIKAFVNDPEVQKQAKHYASVAGAYVMQAGGAFVATIQQGPAGVRFFSFIGGVGSAVVAVLAMINPLKLIFGPVIYVLSGYQLLFSLTTIIFEMPPEWITKVPGVTAYQDMLMDKAKFLTETLGRGLFYVFQGTLWLCFASLQDWDKLLCGLWMVFVGALNIMIHYGGYTVFAEKVAQGYHALSRPTPAGP